MACRCLLLMATASLSVTVTAVSAAARTQPAMPPAHRWALHHLFPRPHTLSGESVLRLDAGESLGVPTTIHILYVLSVVMVSEGSKYVSFPDMVSAMVTKEVEGRLARNTTSLTAAPSLLVQGAVQSATNPPPGLSARQSVKSLLADVPVGGNREQERPGNELGLDQAVLPHDPWREML
ncbi:hypothetical protein E2C01_092437 [Portunus trituberculatus]|uniref:Uncharacterized protein n=1 Tax=Portunus trituberculatus TaxID=210409 RepID=A0A5B7JRR1_PORTR|nr:hypothetical protein [Portunus trituberculatus]